MFFKGQIGRKLLIKGMLLTCCRLEGVEKSRVTIMKTFQEVEKVVQPSLRPTLLVLPYGPDGF